MIDPPDYQAPGAPRAWRRFDQFTFVGHLSGWAVGLALAVVPCLFILPRYETILAEYEAEVPAVTRGALAIARWVRRYGILLAPLAVAHSAAAALWYPRAGLAQRRLYRLLLTLVVCAVFGGIILALFLPIASINESLLGGPPKQ